MIPTLHIRLLGDFLLLLDDYPVTGMSSLRLQSLFAYLVLHRAVPQDRSHVAFLLWPDSTEAQAHTNLRQLLYHLRQALPHADRFLMVSKQNLQWLPGEAALTLDVQEIEEALTQAEQAEQRKDAVGTRNALERVVQLYRGDLLPSCYDDWIVPERDRWHQIFLQAAERLIALLEHERAYSAAITVAQTLLRQDSLQEATYRQLMRFYALSGDRVAALRVYHNCVTVLERELGVGPSKATRAIYEALVQSEALPGSLLGAKAESLPVLHQDVSDDDVQKNKDSVVQYEPNDPIDLLVEYSTRSLAEREIAAPLLGRKAELQQIQGAWRKTMNGQAGIVILTGEAGIGKTRLAEEMEAWVRRLGMMTACARCYAAAGALAYSPVTTWLRTDAVRAGLSTLEPTWLTEIARLVPEVLSTQIPPPAAITENWQQQRFFEALAHAILSARQPLLLLLDDLQWCDSETLAWLHYLLRFAPRAHLLFLGTVRSEEMQPDHSLISVLATFQRDGLMTEIPLGPLTAAETTSLAEHVTGETLDPDDAAHLYAETEGNPLFVVEMARAGTLGQDGRGLLGADGPFTLLHQSASTLPPTVQSVLATRLMQLSPLAREVANVAAVIGREFAFSVLVQASEEREGTIVQALDELWRRRIVREQDMGTAEAYDFSHEKLREQTYASLSPATRRFLHRRVAEAFKIVYTENQDVVSGQIAVHYERAGIATQAIVYYHRAAEAAFRIYANADALNALGRAIFLLEAQGAGQQGVSWEIATQVYEARGDICREIGLYEDSRQAYQRAMIYVPVDAYLQQAKLQRKIAKAWNYDSTNPQDIFHGNAIQAFQEAEHILTQIADPSSLEWRNAWVELCFDQIWPLRGSADDMTITIEKVRPIIGQYGTNEQRKLLSEAESMRNVVRDRHKPSEKAIASRRVALAEAQQTDDKGQIGTCHLALGIFLLWSNHLEEAEEHLRSAQYIGEQAGISWLQTRCLTFLPFIFRRRGQVEQVRRVIAEAQAIGATQNNHVLTGHRAWVAWRESNYAEAESYGRTSLCELRQEVNPFQWVGRWPLIGVALTQGKVVEAMKDVYLLLHPTQQPPPEALEELLKSVRGAWDAGEQEEAARTLLQRVVPLAEKMGYL